MNDTWRKYLTEKRLRDSNVDGRRKRNELNDKRNPFESDFGRVIFSSACRRLHDKTQVFPLTSDDNIHSRLTHSMEVMNIGYSLAIDLLGQKKFLEYTELTSDEILRIICPILKSACLVHDIGNPPFGHFGEQVIQDYFSDLFEGLKICADIKNGDEYHTPLAKYIWDNIGGERKQGLKDFLDLNNEEAQLDYTAFDGNAEGFRVLAMLQYVGDPFGLNLTKATLAASLKYPNAGIIRKDANNPDIGDIVGCHKHGVFHTELMKFRDIAGSTGLSNVKDVKYVNRHPLSFLVEAADSICYLTMDLEDANRKGFLNIHDVLNAFLDDKNVYIDDFRDKIQNLKQDSMLGKYTRKKTWINHRNALLAHLTQVAIGNFVNNIEDICSGKYNKELLEDNDSAAQVLKTLSYKKIISGPEIVSLEVTGRSVITGIFDTYFHLLFHPDKKFRAKARTLISNSIMRTILHEHKIASLTLDDLRNREKQSEIAKEVDEEFESFDVAELSAEEIFRLIRDFVAGMTDKFALNHYQKLSGQRL